VFLGNCRKGRAGLFVLERMQQRNCAVEPVFKSVRLTCGHSFRTGCRKVYRTDFLFGQHVFVLVFLRLWRRRTDQYGGH
jgi:hypothetical protein